MMLVGEHLRHDADRIPGKVALTSPDLDPLGASLVPCNSRLTPPGMGLDP